MIVRHDLAVFIDNEAGADAFLRKDLEEEIALINDAGDVDRGQAVGLVDIDIVLLVGAKSGAMRGHRIRPEPSARRDRLHQPPHGPVPVLGNDPEARYKQQSENERSWSHDASLLKILINNFCLTQRVFFRAAGVDHIIGEFFFLLQWHLAFQAREYTGFRRARPVHRAFDLLLARDNSPLLFYRLLCTRPIRSESPPRKPRRHAGCAAPISSNCRDARALHCGMHDGVQFFQLRRIGEERQLGEQSRRRRDPCRKRRQRRHAPRRQAASPHARRSSASMTWQPSLAKRGCDKALAARHPAGQSDLQHQTRYAARRIQWYCSSAWRSSVGPRRLERACRRMQRAPCRPDARLPPAGFRGGRNRPAAKDRKCVPPPLAIRLYSCRHRSTTAPGLMKSAVTIAAARSPPPEYRRSGIPRPDRAYANGRS